MPRTYTARRRGYGRIAGRAVSRLLAICVLAGALYGVFAWGIAPLTRSSSKPVRHHAPAIPLARIRIGTLDASGASRTKDARRRLQAAGLRRGPALIGSTRHGGDILVYAHGLGPQAQLAASMLGGMPLRARVAWHGATLPHASLVWVLAAT
jgi:hypothetical protein